MPGADDFIGDALGRAGASIPARAPDDLGEILEARRARLARRRVVARAAAVAAVVLVVVGAVALRPGGDDDAAEVIADLPSTTTTVGGTTPSTTGPDTATTAPGPTTTEATTPSTEVAPTTTDPGTPSPPVPSPITDDTPISLYGLGAVRAGMTVAEAEAATGQPFEIDSFEAFGGACYFAQLPEVGTMYLMITNPPGFAGPPEAGTIGRVSVTGGSWRTISGIGVGSTRADVLATYPGQIEESGHAYQPGGSYLDLVPQDAADAAYRIRFVTDPAGRVIEIHAGLATATSAIEGCA